MGEGEEDRRVRRTRTALRAALMSLMTERGYARLTVADIIDRADVGRSTFYAHYRDKGDLLADLLDSLRGILATRSDPVGGSARGMGFSRALFLHVSDQRSLLRALLGQGEDPEVTGRIRLLLGDVVRADLDPWLPSDAATRVPVDLVTAHVVTTLVTVLAWWVRDDFRSPVAQVEAAFRVLAIPAVRAALAPARIP